MKMKLTFILMSLLLSNVAFADYVRIWRGHAHPEMSRSDFVGHLNRALFPATGALAKKSATLKTYQPVVLPKLEGTNDIPDEVALLAYENEENYRSYRKTPEGQHYGDLHWDMFVKETSRSLVPEEYAGDVQIEKAYAIKNVQKWNEGKTHFRVLKRSPSSSEEEYTRDVKEHIGATETATMLGYYVLVADEYVLEYVILPKTDEITESTLETHYSDRLLTDLAIRKNIGGLVYPVWASTETHGTRATWKHHIDAWGERDLQEIMKDYQSNSILIIKDHIYRGTAEIQAAFVELFAQFDTVTDTGIDRVTIENNVVYITWWAQYPDNEHRTYGSDTFVIKNGVIETQTIANH